MKKSKEVIGMWSLFVVGFNYREIANCFKVAPKTVSARLKKEYGNTDWYAYILKPKDPIKLGYFDPEIISRLAQVEALKMV
jgi:hypothetical protein